MANLKNLLQNVSGINRGERLVTMMMFLWFFITICSYYVIRPVRSSLFLTFFGSASLPWVYMGAALATGVAAWLYSKCAGIPRRRLIGGTLVVFALNLFAWWWIAGQARSAHLAGTGGWGWASPAFYIWTDVFSILAVTVFWIYANDIFPPASAKRIFGVIGAAGPIGGITGAWITGFLVKHVGTVNMILVAAGIYLTALVPFLIVERFAASGGAALRTHAAKAPRDADLSKISGVLRQIISSRFLLLLTAVVCLERMVPDFIDYVFQTLGKAAYPLEDDFTGFFARFEVWHNTAAIVASVFLTRVFLQRAGVGRVLMSLPATILAGGAAFIMLPVLPVMILLKGMDEFQRHSWFKVGKEVLYTSTSRDTIYRVKGYIDMFFYRFSRGIAGIIILAASATSGAKPAVLITAVLPLALCWLYCARELGREYQKLEANPAASPTGSFSRPTAAQ